jgi:general secretion pathway protein H
MISGPHPTLFAAPLPRPRRDRRASSVECASPRDRRGGFTLVELLVVLAIAAAVMAAVPPLFSAALPGVELTSAARRTLTTLRWARDQAIRQGRDLTLVVDVGQNRLELTGHSPVALPKHLELRLEAAQREMIDDERGAIRFFPDGTSTGGRILLISGNSGYQVGVTWLTGHARMAPWDPTRG